MRGNKTIFSSQGSANISHNSPMKPNKSQNNYSVLSGKGNHSRQGSNVVKQNLGVPIKHDANQSTSWQHSQNKSKLQQTLDEKVPKDQLFLVEHINTNQNSRRGSTSLGMANTLGSTQDQHHQTIFNKQSMSTAFNTTLQTASTPEPYHNLHPQVITKQTQRFFTKHLGQREQELHQRSLVAQGILKEQQMGRTTQEPPLVKGRRNSHYQSQSFASNAIFYQDYKGNPQPNAHRAASLSFTPDRLNSRSQTQLVMEVRNQFMMNQDGSNDTKTFGKKVSLNMKNYSSLSIGENDGLRKIYDRSASNLSIKSCHTPKNQELDQNITIIGTQASFNQRVANSVSMYASPKRLQNKCIEKQQQSGNRGSQSFIFGYDSQAQTKSSNFVNTKIGHEEAKIVWPSKVEDKPKQTMNQAFNRHAKMIPQSQPKRGVQQGPNQRAANEQSRLIESYVAQKNASPAKPSNSIADAFSGDSFQFIHSQREQSREAMRDSIVQKFLLNNSNMSISDTRDKLNLQNKCPLSVSLAVGRDDTQERHMLNLQHGHILQCQIKYQHHHRKSEQITSMKEGKLEQRLMSDFNQQKDEEERLKKEQDQQSIQKGLERIMIEQHRRQAKLEQEKKDIQKQNKMNEFREKERQNRQAAIQKVTQRKLKSALDFQIEIQKKKRIEDLEENSQIFKVRVMQNVHPKK